MLKIRYYSESFTGRILEIITGLFLIIVTLPLQILYIIGTFTERILDRIATYDELICRKIAELLG